MAQVHFTAWLRSIVPDGPVNTSGSTVGDALEALFAERPHLRSYVLDEQGRLRKHVCIFADGARLPREARARASDPPDSQLHVMQALSGGLELMSDRLLVSTRKGLFVLERENGGWASRRRVPGRAGDRRACATRATARSMPRSSTAISDRSCIAPTTAGEVAEIGVARVSGRRRRRAHGVPVLDAGGRRSASS